MNLWYFHSFNGLTPFFNVLSLNRMLNLLSKRDSTTEGIQLLWLYFVVKHPDVAIEYFIRTYVHYICSKYQTLLLEKNGLFTLPNINQCTL